MPPENPPNITAGDVRALCDQGIHAWTWVHRLPAQPNRLLLQCMVCHVEADLPTDDSGKVIPDA
jgi:hypothetical protein